MMGIFVLNNADYPRSKEENMVVITVDDGVELKLHGNKRDYIKLDLEHELKLLDIILTHLKETLK